MFAVGDIVEIFAPNVGYKKYHVCIHAGGGESACQFLFLNSDPTFAGTFVVDCSRVPCLPPSETGKTAFSFAILPRYNQRQLKLYNAKKLGVLDPALAAELLEFAKTVRTMAGSERKTVVAALTAISLA